jgi:hypothetical protein
MKNSIVFAMLIIGLISCDSKSEAEIGEYTTIEVEKTFDAGTVAKGEIVEAKIEIKNTGDFPLVIANIRPACSCTVSEYSEDPVAPGEIAYIYAEVDTDKTGKGVITKPITISANTRPTSTKIDIVAKVID